MNWRAKTTRFVILALLLLTLAASAGADPAAAQRPNGAGVVVRFGDGSLIYAYVQFNEETLTSEQLLYRAGLNVVVAPYSGLGAGVCAINGTGCPSDNCFCESYTNPAYFWHFYGDFGGGWSELLQGASSRVVRDGDIDGWSWTAGASGLPAVTIDEIALMNGVDRNPPPPTPTNTPIPATDTPTLAPTFTPTQTASPTTPPASPSPTATGTAAPTNTSSATATTTPLPTATATLIAATSTPPRASPTLSSTQAATVRPSPTGTTLAVIVQPGGTQAATVRPSPTGTTLAVIVQPGGTPVPIDIVTFDDESPGTTWLLFGGLVALIGGAAGLAWALRRKAA